MQYPHQYRVGSLGESDKSELFGNIAELLGCGLQLDQALLLLSEHRRKNVRRVCPLLLENVRQGRFLHDSMRLANAFSDLDTLVCKIGEDSGKLPHLLRELSTFYEERTRTKAVISKALSYPAIVIATAMLSLFVMSNWVIPGFSMYYESGSRELPTLTAFLLKLPGILPMAIACFIALIFTGMIFNKIAQKNMQVRALRDRIYLSIPLFGSWFKVSLLERFSTLMGLMLYAGINLSTAFELLIKSDPAPLIRHACKHSIRMLSDGSSLFEALENTKLNDRVLLGLIRNGEEAAQLPIAFSQGGQHYNMRIRSISSSVAKWLEPILILVTGLIVGLVLAGLYLPMFEMGKMLGL